MALILPGNVASATADAGYNVANSCRFAEGSDAHLSRTFASAGNRKTFTVSFWYKTTVKTTTGQDHMFGAIFDAAADGSNSDDMYFHTNRLNFSGYYGSTQFILRTTAKYRDPSAWTHFVVAFDTTQGTAANRIKMYANGTQITAFDEATYPAEDFQTSYMNLDRLHNIGTLVDNDVFPLDGYLAEFCFIDGTAYAASDFGEFDSDSPTIWKPKDVSDLTFGTNGCYLDFEDSSNLGNDANGGTDYASTNLAATDQATDTPTNNFATLNPLYRYTNNMTYTEGNVKVTGAGNSWQGANSTFYINKGKWFFEVKFSSATDIGNYYIGWTTAGDYNISEPYDNGIHYYNADSGEIYANSSALTTADYGTFANGDVMGMALDYDNSLLTVYKNGSALVSDYDFSSASTTAKGGNYVTPTVAHYGSGVVEWNFGNPSWALSSAVADAAGYGAFEYAVPSGYYSLCTKNLATYG